jgi:hypothetical protein
VTANFETQNYLDSAVKWNNMTRWKDTMQKRPNTLEAFPIFSARHCALIAPGAVIAIAGADEIELATSRSHPSNAIFSEMTN